MENADYDLIIRGGTLYDGTGGAPRRADVAVAGGRIALVGRARGATAEQEFDAAGLCVTPGFIDLHTHSDRAFSEHESARDAVNVLRQGCTTVVTGNCGGGRLDVADFLSDLAQTGVGVNTLHLAGHGAIRRAVMEMEDRPPTDAELDAMTGMLEEALEQGAAGMSTGLLYLPGAYTETGELVHLSRPLAERDRLYASHIRNENERVRDSIEEVIRIGRESGARVHISHIKCVGETAWGRAPELCGLIEAARADGVRVTADQYPYRASATRLNAMVTPLEARHNIQEILKDPEAARRLMPGIAGLMRHRGGPENLLLTTVDGRPEWEGKRLSEVADLLGVSPLEACARLLREHSPRVISFSMREDDVRFFMARPYVATGSDGSARRQDAEGFVHPRSYGTFARKLARYARDEAVLSVEQAVRAGSGLPADTLGLTDRGYVREGCAADLVVMDLDALGDHATFEAPRQCATGLRRVYVNGRAAVVDDKATGVRAGLPLRGGGRPL